MTRVPLIQQQAYADNGNPYTRTRLGRVTGSTILGAISYAAYTKEYRTPEFRKDFIKNLTENGIKDYSRDEIRSIMKRSIRISKAVAVMIYAGVGFLVGNIIDSNINMRRKDEAEAKKPVRKY